MWVGSSLFTIALFVVAIIVISRAIRVVPQQHALVIERLGRFYAVLQPGLNFVIPFVDRVAYTHDLREIPFDVPSQICITKDNTQLQVDGILYFQVTDPKLASYGSSNFRVAITQLAQTTLRSVIGRMELDRTFEEREHINGLVVAALDQAAGNWGVKVLRYEIKDLTPPKEILHAMQAQITAEREKRAVIATSEGKQQEQINLANGARAAAIAKSEGEKQAEINQAQGHAAALLAIAEANAKAIRQVAEAIEAPGGIQAVNLKVAEQYVAAFAKLAKAGNTLIVPSNLVGPRRTRLDGDDRVQGTVEMTGSTDMQLKGSTFIVTGGASGLGAATARMVVEGGGRAVIADLKEAEGKALAQELGAGARFVRTDVTDEASAQAAVAAALGGFGRVDGLVNCAGIVYGEKTVGKDGPHTLAGFVRTININLIGTFNMIRLAADAMTKNAPNDEGERGVIVNTASVAAFDGQIGQAAYSASKAGVAGMTLPIARDLARNGIRVMTIAPGLFRDADGRPDPARDRRVAGQDGAVSAAPRPAFRVRVARARDRRQRHAERRGDPPRRRDPDGAQVSAAGAGGPYSRLISASAATIIAMKKTSVHDGIARPRKYQPASAHSPLPLNTLVRTSVSGSVSSM